MTWYAIDALEDSLEATRAFLLPFDLRRWLKLMVIVFFLGGAGSGGSSVSSNAGNTAVQSDGFAGPTPVAPDSIPWGLIAGIVAVVLALVLLFAVVGAVMRFVFVDALRTRNVVIRRRFSERFGSGLRLFAFEFALFLILFLPMLALVAPVLLGFGMASAALVLLAIPFLLLGGLVVGVVVLLTNEFVVPVMIAENVGVLDGWRRFWPTLTGEWKQFLVYLVARFVVGLAVGVLVGIVAGVFAVPLLVIFGAIGFGAANLGLAVLAAIAIPFVLLFLLGMLFVQVPVQSYLGYYALLVLGDANAAFDLIPDLRREVRGGAGEAGTTGDEAF